MRLFFALALLVCTAAFPQQNDTTFVRLQDIAPEILIDMKYATNDNFLKSKVYDCAECYLREKTARALAKANADFMKKGYRIKVFDCYRPLDVQRKMWAIVSNPIYVADPAKGSIHNRGGAVDLTIVDSQGNELDMGTPFDHFGPESAHDYPQLSEQVKENRRLLRKIMGRHKFKTFDSEWWHYNLKGASKQPVANFKWDCPN